MARTAEVGAVVVVVGAEVVVEVVAVVVVVTGGEVVAVVVVAELFVQPATIASITTPMSALRFMEPPEPDRWRRHHRCLHSRASHHDRASMSR
jgi:hypothetical protein